MKVDVALQMNWAGEPLAFGNDHTTTAFFKTRLDGLRESFGVLCRAAFHCSELGNANAVVGKLRTLELGHVKGSFDRRDRLAACIRGAGGSESQYNAAETSGG